MASDRAKERAFWHGFFVGVAVLAIIVAVLAPRVVFHRTLCFTWAKPGHTAVCRGNQ